ncbi:MAG TPA: hypothetical protein VFI06_09800 [Chitinophagaceae bacterium]|nr:hypothetical protein [Chitinophagaceae bacterium]
MAITNNCSTFLFYARSLGVSYDKTLMLGRLNLYATQAHIQEDINRFKNNSKKLEEVVFKDGYSEPLFEILGASQTDSIDFSDYEKANLIHDLNLPVPSDLKGKYTAVVDGGTLEHIFNFPTAIRNCMEMLQVGGHYLGITPANNLLGHGLYQFSPELYYGIFREENGFEVKKIIIVTQNSVSTQSDWYEVADPKKVRSRVMLSNSNPTYLMVLAKKIKEQPIFQKPVQQSDYEMVWNINSALQKNEVPKDENRLKYLYRKYVPRPLKVVAHRVYDLFNKKEEINEDLGKINADHFKKMKI